MSEYNQQAARELFLAAADELQRLSDSAYLAYSEKMRADDCLGSEAMMAAGTFNGFNLEAHIEAGRLLGMHQARAQAADYLRRQSIVCSDALIEAALEVVKYGSPPTAVMNRLRAELGVTAPPSPTHDSQATKSKDRLKRAYFKTEIFNATSENAPPDSGEK